MPYEIDERWLELDFGSLDGVPVSRSRIADIWARWRVDPHFRAGGGETMDEMHKRVVSRRRGSAGRRRTPDDRGHVPRLADQGGGDLGARCGRDRRLAVPSGSSIGLPDTRRPERADTARLQRDAADDRARGARRRDGMSHSGSVAYLELGAVRIATGLDWIRIWVIVRLWRRNGRRFRGFRDRHWLRGRGIWIVAHLVLLGARHRRASRQVPNSSYV